MSTKAKLAWLAIAAGAICVAFNAYALSRFGWHWGGTPDSMNQAGGFLGGVVGPILNFITLIAVLATTAMQAEELRISNDTLEATKEELAQSREIANNQLKLNREEAAKRDLSKVLELLDAELQDMSKIQYVKGCRVEDGIDDLASFWKNRNKDRTDHETLKVVSIIKEICNGLTSMNRFLDEYEQITDFGIDGKYQGNGNLSPVVYYYELKYCRYAVAFSNAGAISQKDVEMFLRGIEEEPALHGSEEEYSA